MKLIIAVFVSYSYNKYEQVEKKASYCYPLSVSTLLITFWDGPLHSQALIIIF